MAMILAILVRRGYSRQMTLGRTSGAWWLTVGLRRKEKLKMVLKLVSSVAGKINKPQLRKEASKNKQV